MHSQRNTILILFLMVTAYIFFTWNSDKTAALNQQNIPTASIISAGKTEEVISKIITVNTDLFYIEIDLNGGDIVKADLKDQKQDIDSDENFHLLRSNDNFKYAVNSSLLMTSDTNGIKTQSLIKPVYKTEQNSYQLSDNENSLSVVLTFTDSSDTTYKKIYTFNRGSHSVSVKHEITNVHTNSLISIQSGLEQSVVDPELSSGIFGTSAYRGVAFSTDSSRYTKESFDDIASNSVRPVLSQNGGWISMIQHYFVAAWVGQTGKNTINMYGENNNQNAVINIVSEPLKVSTGDSVSLENKLWIGPKNQEEMEQTAQYLDLTVDYGWLSFISVFLFKCLKWIYAGLSYLNIANWGLAIIILTFCVRGLMYPLTKKQYVSMAKMRLLAPKLNELKERYKNDRQRLSMEMMELYKRENANPLGGCLPLLIQMPIFIALYWTLMESTELRHQPFVLWIRDLSVHDPYFVLPILMGVTMFLLQKMSPTPITDPMQKKIMTAMPIVFTAMFCYFPAGLTIYWVVSNTVSIIQQFLIYRALEKKGLSLKKK